MDWHSRFTQQATWTADLRGYIYKRVGLAPGQRILEVGCGTGAVLTPLSLKMREAVWVDAPLHIHGLDLNPNHLALARRNAPAARLVCGDALALPYHDDSFDFVFCHFLLLWLPDPFEALYEMQRVLRPGGWLAAIAEPDYGGRVDYPERLAGLGRLQADSLRRQGANPEMGRRLKGLFSRLNLENVECGVMGAQWQGKGSLSDLDGEWQMIRADLQNVVSIEELEDYYTIEKQARQSGERVLYVPTFYAVGQFGETKSLYPG